MDQDLRADHDCASGLGIKSPSTSSARIRQNSLSAAKTCGMEIGEESLRDGAQQCRSQLLTPFLGHPVRDQSSNGHGSCPLMKTSRHLQAIGHVHALT